MKAIIVMPAYNAEKTIKNVFEMISPDAMSCISEFIIVDDGSTDSTIKIVDELKKKHNIKLLKHKQNIGYGGAQKTGFKQALKDNADIMVLLHADGQYDPNLIPKLIAPLEKGEADIVQGSRILGGGALDGGMPFYKYIGNRFLTLLENLAYGMNLAEYHSGYMLYSKKALTTIPFEKLSNTFHYDGEMLLMAGKKKLKILELPIPTHYADEKSHLNPITYGIDVLKIILKNFMGKYDF